MSYAPLSSASASDMANAIVNCYLNNLLFALKTFLSFLSFIMILINKLINIPVNSYISALCL